MNVHDFLDYRMEKTAVSKSLLRKAYTVKSTGVPLHYKTMKMPKGEMLTVQKARDVIAQQKAGRLTAKRFGEAKLTQDSFKRNRLGKKDPVYGNNRLIAEGADSLALGKALKGSRGAGAKRVSGNHPSLKQYRDSGSDYVENIFWLESDGSSFDGARKGLTNKNKRLGVLPKKNAQDRVMRRLYPN